METSLTLQDTNILTQAEQEIMYFKYMDNYYSKNITSSCNRGSWILQKLSDSYGRTITSCKIEDKIVYIHSGSNDSFISKINWADFLNIVVPDEKTFIKNVCEELILSRYVSQIESRISDFERKLNAELKLQIASRIENI